MVSYDAGLRLAGVMFDDAALERYARHIVLKEIGGSGQLRLAQATAALVGAGGIGSPAIQYLAAAGVGHLVLIDDDRVSLSNLQRQTIYRSADIDAPKIERAARAIRDLNPAVTVTTHETRLDAANAERLLGGADVVVDGSDSFATRLIVADAALALRIPLVAAAVGQFEGQLGVFRGWEPDRPCYRCFVGDAPARAEASCAEQGVLGAMTGVMGSLAALEAIRAVVPFGADPAGQVLIADALDFRFRTIRLPKDPGCRTCGVVIQQ